MYQLAHPQKYVSSSTSSQYMPALVIDLVHVGDIVAILAETSLRSPQNLAIFKIKKPSFWIKVSKKYIWLDLKKTTG